MTRLRRAVHSKQLECTKEDTSLDPMCKKEDISLERICRKEDISLDRISKLPDEVLVLILSHLTFKEVAATCVLSQQWRYVWLLTPKLDFNDKVSLVKVKLANGNRAVLKKVRSNFVSRVNGFVALRDDSTIKEFKVSFNFSRAYKVCIDAWLKYALERKVETLELNFSNGGFDGRDAKDFYAFPFGILHKEEPLTIMHFTNLRKISLAYVDVNDFVINSLLHNSPLLEDLSVSLSRKLSFLWIRGPFPSLKYLELIWCPNLKQVNICDVQNLVCLKFAGDEVEVFIFDKVPMLVDMFATTFHYHIDKFVRRFSSILPQLERLEIQISGPIISDGLNMKMSNLKQLVVIYRCSKASTLLPLTNLIHAAPQLEKFVIKTSPTSPLDHGYDLWWDVIADWSVHRLKDHHKLKEVEFVGYRGTTYDLELVSDLLQKAVALERISIDTREFLSFPCELMNHEDINNPGINVKNHARIALQNRVPHGVILEIL